MQQKKSKETFWICDKTYTYVQVGVYSQFLGSLTSGKVFNTNMTIINTPLSSL